MKKFTAKQFVKRPRDIYEAAHEDGKCEITHDRFRGRFQVYFLPDNVDEIQCGDILEVSGQKLRVIPWKPITPYSIGDQVIKSDGERGFIGGFMNINGFQCKIIEIFDHYQCGYIDWDNVKIGDNLYYEKYNFLVTGKY